MQEWIRQIIIYVILVTVLRGLIMKPQYEQYFRFFSGIVLILLVVSPCYAFYIKIRLGMIRWSNIYFKWM